MKIRQRLSTKAVPFVSLILEKTFGCVEYKQVKCVNYKIFSPDKMIQKKEKCEITSVIPPNFSLDHQTEPLSVSSATLRMSCYFMPPSPLPGSLFHLKDSFPLLCPETLFQSSKFKSSTISPCKPFLTSLDKCCDPFMFSLLFHLQPIIL